MKTLKTQQMVERQIVRAAINGLLKTGHTLTVFDGEYHTVKNSTDRRAIFAAMFTTDEDYLITGFDPATGRGQGFVRFVYGNDGWDVICDYSTRLESALETANKRAEFWEARSRRARN